MELSPELRKITDDAAAVAEINSEEAFEQVLESVCQRERFMRLSNLSFLATVLLIIEADRLKLKGDERKQWIMDQVLGESAEQAK